jgi:hypothetical protein
LRAYSFSSGRGLNIGKYHPPPPTQGKNMRRGREKRGKCTRKMKKGERKRENGK